MPDNLLRAVIDLGSHSALLLVVRTEKGQLVPLKERFRITRLGQEVNNLGYLPQENQQRALDVLEEYRHELQTMECREVTVLGTEALRRAQNADELVQKIKQRFGWEVRVLSAQEEATYAYLGAISAFENFREKNFTVIDVGGASTELTLGRGVQIKSDASFPIGAARLAEEFGFKEKLKRSDLPKIREFLDGIFDEKALQTLTTNALLVGTGGTITTLATVKMQAETYDPEKIRRISLTLDELLLLFEKMNALTLKERRQLKGLEAGREDVILYGTLIYIHILQRTEKWRIKVSPRGLRYGFLIAQMQDELL